MTAFVVNLGSTRWPDMAVLPMVHTDDCWHAGEPPHAIPAHWQPIDRALVDALRTADPSTVRFCSLCCPRWARAGRFTWRAGEVELHEVER
jgi:hypothetical protein